jgi:hypothetical protein
MNNLAKYVVCPYFRSDQLGKILCEGIQKNAYIHLVFQNSNDKKPYMQRYCFSMENYKNCRICDMLDLKNCIEKDDSYEQK